MGLHLDFQRRSSRRCRHGDSHEKIVHYSVHCQITCLYMYLLDFGPIQAPEAIPVYSRNMNKFGKVEDNEDATYMGEPVSTTERL